MEDLICLLATVRTLNSTCSNLTIFLHIRSVLPETKCEEVCYEDLGCFSNDPPYDRLPGFPPQPPNDVNVRFLLYTRFNRDLWMEVKRKDPDSLTDSLFHPGRKTVFYIHGWNNIGYKSSFTESLRNALLDLVCFLFYFDMICGKTGLLISLVSIHENNNSNDNN